MDSFWNRVRVWWQGKKTMVGGALVMAAAVAGVWFGKLDPASGVMVLGVGLSIAGFSAKANRHQAELLTALQGVATVGADERAGKSAQAIQDAEQAAMATAGPLIPGLAAAAGASIHLSAGSAEELNSLVKILAPSTTVTNVGGASAPMSDLSATIAQLIRNSAGSIAK